MRSLSVGSVHFVVSSSTARSSGTDANSKDSSPTTSSITTLTDHTAHSINGLPMQTKKPAQTLPRHRYKSSEPRGATASSMSTERQHDLRRQSFGHARCGYWINRAPTGYDTVERTLIPNGDAHLIRRAFALRTRGLSYPEIERATGLKYSTVRYALDNRVYLGLTRLRDEWYPGRHEALVTQAEFDASQRGHVRGRRRGKDLLSGRVRCGQCGKITRIDTNGRGKPIYRCHPGAKAAAYQEDQPQGSTGQHDSASNYSAPTINSSKQSVHTSMPKPKELQPGRRSRPDQAHSPPSEPSDGSSST